MDEVDGRRRRAALRLGMGAGIVAAAVVGAVAFAAFGPASHTVVARPGPTAIASGGTSTAAPSSPVVAGGTVVLPAPARVVGGVPLGFPHTQLGAISAAARWDQVLDWLHYSTAKQQIHEMVLPADESAMNAGAQQAAAEFAQQLGLPDDADPGASYATTQPVGYSVISSSPDEVQVAILLDTTTSRLGAQPTTGTITLPSVVVWDSAVSDWRLTDQQPVSGGPDVAQPGTGGWTALAFATQ